MFDIVAFRRMALELPGSEEHEHFGRPAFRVGTKIFVTLWPEEMRGVLKFTPEAQREFLRVNEAAFVGVAGAWGARGWTSVLLEHVQEEQLRDALETAWANVAPRKLVKARRESRTGWPVPPAD